MAWLLYSGEEACSTHQIGGCFSLRIKKLCKTTVLHLCPAVKLVSYKYSIMKSFQNTNKRHILSIFNNISYITLLNVFRVARCSSSGGPIVSPQALVSSPSVSSRTVCALHPNTVRLLTEGDDTKGCGDTIGPPDFQQCAARNTLRSVM